MKRKKITAMLLCMMLAGVLLLNFTGCTAEIQAADLMEDIAAGTVEGKAADEIFIQSSADFAVELFKRSVDPDKNSLVSPLSVLLALAMTANGADARTKAEMETVLGGALPIEALNEYLYAYVKNLPSEEKYKLEIANSIWFRNDGGMLEVRQDFLQKNADYYNAAAYGSAFDKQTVKDINRWVEEKTDGMIEEIVDEINPLTVMYLINALVFDAEWERIYNKEDIYDGRFRSCQGKERSVEMMRSEESRYLRDENAVGFLKHYNDGKYSFAALLPNETVSVGDYVASLTGTRLRSVLSNAETASVTAHLPKFSYDYSIVMNEALQEMGMPAAFSEREADFTRLGSSSLGNIYIGEVLHKTYISVNERGTKAGAVTSAGVQANSAPEDRYTVTLDRPFVYAVIDNSTNLPVFLGTVQDIGK